MTHTQNLHINLYKSLNRHKVRYLVIGGISAILHGMPRTTLDIDILIEPSENNTRNLLKALLDAGLYTASLTSVKDILANEISIFKDRIRLDVQTKTPGIDFKKAWKRKTVFKVSGINIYSLNIDDLILSKRASGRKEDKEDIKYLKLIKKTHN